MSNISPIIGFLIGILGFLFLTWRRLKEDYISDQIFSTGFIIIAFMLVGFSLSLAVYNIQNTIFFNTEGLVFWLPLLFGTIGFVFCFYRFKLRFFETLESVGLGLIFLFASSVMGSSVKTLNLKATLFALVIFALIPLFFVFDKNYKKFSWYKSGKVGFSGLTILGIFFLVRAIIALISPNMLSFIGKSDAILSSIVAFIFFLTLYNLSNV